ncbi:MAG: hypothetical protein ACJ76S_05140 [Solirubrobacteraceae bacterium]|jgi:hypothetical protein
MVGSGPPPPVRGCQAAIEQLLRTRAPLAQVEGALDHADLPPDEKAALWMLAWSSIDPGATAHQELERRLAPGG